MSKILSEDGRQVLKENITTQEIIKYTISNI